MSTIAFTLNTLLVCLIILPFVLFGGSVLINVYFKTKQQYEMNCSMKFLEHFYKKGKAAKENVQKNI